MDLSLFEQKINSELEKTLEEIKEQCKELDRLYPKLPTNNWLKMHNKPMIRNSKQVRKKRRMERIRKTESKLFELLGEIIEMTLPPQFEKMANNYVNVQNINKGEYDKNEL